MRKPNLKTLLAISTILLATYNHQAWGQLSGGTFSDAQESKKAKLICVYDGIPSFAENKDGQLTGLLVDIMKNFSDYVKNEKGIDVTLEFVYTEGGDFQTFMTDVREAEGGVFGLSNISISEERKKDYLFSPPFMDNVSLLLSSGNAKTLSSIEDISTGFKGMTAYSLPSSSYYVRLLEIKDKYFPSMEIVNLSSEAEIIDKLATNDNAFAILDVTYYLDILQKKLNITRQPVGSKKDDQFGILMPKSNDWAPLLKEFFDSGFIGSSEYSEIISNNLGSSALRLLNSVKNQ